MLSILMDYSASVRSVMLLALAIMVMLAVQLVYLSEANAVIGTTGPICYPFNEAAA